MQERSDILILLDRSGSMQQGREDHIGGLRSFVHDSQNLAGDIRLSFVQFDSHDPCEVLFREKPIAEVQDEDITLIPRSGTPLLDAIGRTLAQFDGLPGPVIMMIITDGAENESKEFKKEQIQKLIKTKEEKGWKVLYLGANVDEFVEAGAIGVAAGATLGYSTVPDRIMNAYRITGRSTAATYSARTSGQGWGQAMQNMNFTPQQQKDSKTNTDEDKENKP